MYPLTSSFDNATGYCRSEQFQEFLQELLTKHPDWVFMTEDTDYATQEDGVNMIIGISHERSRSEDIIDVIIRSAGTRIGTMTIFREQALDTLGLRIDLHNDHTWGMGCDPQLVERALQRYVNESDATPVITFDVCDGAVQVQAFFSVDSEHLLIEFTVDEFHVGEAVLVREPWRNLQQFLTDWKNR